MSETSWNFLKQSYVESSWKHSSINVEYVPCTLILPARRVLGRPHPYLTLNCLFRWGLGLWDFTSWCHLNPQISTAPLFNLCRWQNIKWTPSHSVNCLYTWHLHLSFFLSSLTRNIEISYPLKHFHPIQPSLHHHGITKWGHELHWRS